MWLLLVLLLTSVSIVGFLGNFHVAAACSSMASGGAAFLLVLAADHPLATEGYSAEGSAGRRGVLVHVAVYGRVLLEWISTCCHVIAEEGSGVSALVLLVYHLKVCCVYKQ